MCKLSDPIVECKFTGRYSGTRLWDFTGMDYGPTPQSCYLCFRLASGEVVIAPTPEYALKVREKLVERMIRKISAVPICEYETVFSLDDLPTVNNVLRYPFRFGVVTDVALRTVPYEIVRENFIQPVERNE